MGYCVYQMPAVQEAPLDYSSNIHDLVQQLHQANPADHRGFLPFLEPLGQNWFKRRYDKYRLVAKLISVPVGHCQVPVVVLVDFLHRANAAYGSGKAVDFEQRYAKLLENHKEDIQRKAQNWVKEQQNPSPWQPPPPPPEELLAVLEPFRPTGRVDAFFLHPDFCRAYRRLELDTHKTAVYDALQHIAGNTSEPERQLLTKEVRDCTLRYVRLYFDRSEGFRFHHVLILGLLSQKWDEETRQNETRRIQETWQAVQQRLLSLPENISSDQYHDAVSQFAELAFPDYLLADEKLWQTLWSTEQREVFLPLSSLAYRALEWLSAGQKLPAVLEGRAGSGKTTLLLYYAAERFSRSLPQGLRALYLTQSERLLKNAEQLINSIIRRLVEERGGQTNGVSAEYRTYHQFALSQLTEEYAERFQSRSRKDGWMDFSRFVGLLRSHDDRYACRDPFARSRDCNPEAVWFILRSYIKGYKIREQGDARWMTSEEYQDSEDIPARDRQVSPELYQEVWKHIWPWYKKLTVPCSENEGKPPFWDDLDLAWEVLAYRRPDAPEYAVLICDEVQDLTRLELAALIQSLSWVRYDLRDLPKIRNWDSRELRLPIIFAGDAHQTINPAVFRWQRVSADLAEALVAHLPQLPEPKVERIELHYNYRNARSIGQLCNALQHLRQQTLGQRSPLQTLWNLPDDQPNQRIRKLIISEQVDLQELLNEGVLIIGPEDDDPNLLYAKPFWQALCRQLPSQNHPNYVVPAEIKGLEQDHVAVAGFGVLWHLWLQDHRSLDQFWNWQNATDNQQISEALRFWVEYFLNRLYVAVSRAREQLWIIETQKGWDAFWARFEHWLEHSAQSQGPMGSDSETVADDHAQRYAFFYSSGDIRELIDVFSGNWQQLAEGFEQLAHDQGNPEHAERSAYYYDRLGNSVQRNIMQAWRLYYRRELIQAADKMLEYKYHTASDWYWEAAAQDDTAWERLTHSRIQPDWRRNLAHHIRSLQTRSRMEIQQIEGMVQILGKHTPQPSRIKPEHRRTWDQVYLRLLTAANNESLAEESHANRWEEIRRNILELAERWRPLPSQEREYRNQLARLAFQLRQYEKAAQHWEDANETQHRDYYIAKAESSRYPACLRWWESAGDYERIMLLYDENRGQEALSPDERRIVGRAAQERQRWRTAFVVLAGLENERVARDIWRNMLSETYKNPSLEDNVTLLLREVYESYRKLDNPDFSRDWTNFLFDLMDVSHQTLSKWIKDQKLREDRIDQVVRGLVLGFAKTSDPSALCSRLRGSWRKQDSEDSNWPTWQTYPQRIAQAVHGVTQRLAPLPDFSSQRHVAQLCWFVLNVVWRFDKRWKRRQRSSAREDHLPDLVSNLLDYISLPQAEAKAKSTVNYLANISTELRTTVQEALACVADLPEDWVRNGEKYKDHPQFRNLSDCVDALAYDLNENLSLTLRGAQNPDDVAPFEWWLLVGRFIEQAPFRPLALDYYLDVLRLAEQFGWSKEQYASINQRLRQYEEKYDRRKRERRNQEREPRERERDHRDRKTVIYINPGEARIIGPLNVSSMGMRAEAVIAFLPDRYQLRVRLSAEQDGHPSLRSDEEVNVSEPEVTEKSWRWRVRCQTSNGEHSLELEWPRNRRALYIHSENEIVLLFAQPSS